MMAKFLLLAGIVAFGCGGPSTSPATIQETQLIPRTAPRRAQTPPTANATDQPDINGQATADIEPMTENGEIHRQALNRLFAKGPSAVLALVLTDPYRQNGKFKGFKIISFKTELPAPLDLRIGDVVSAVNGLAIIMPDDYFRVFQELKVASEIRFNIIRDGKHIEQAYPIIDDR